eukprot:2961772-Alexandrium_andersonii.AAC.1
MRKGGRVRIAWRADAAPRQSRAGTDRRWENAPPDSAAQAQVLSRARRARAVGARRCAGVFPTMVRPQNPC